MCEVRVHNKDDEVGKAFWSRNRRDNAPTKLCIVGMARSPICANLDARINCGAHFVDEHRAGVCFGVQAVRGVAEVLHYPKKRIKVTVLYANPDGAESV